MDLSSLMNNSDILDTLKAQGLGSEQAQGLANGAGEQLAGLDLGDLLGGFDVTSLMEKLDVGALAAQVGLSEAQVQSAIQAVLPKLQEMLQGEGGLSMDSVAGLAGKLFGK